MTGVWFFSGRGLHPSFPTWLKSPQASHWVEAGRVGFQCQGLGRAVGNAGRVAGVTRCIQTKDEQHQKVGSWLSIFPDAMLTQLLHIFLDIVLRILAQKFHAVAFSSFSWPVAKKNGAGFCKEDGRIYIASILVCVCCHADDLNKDNPKNGFVWLVVPESDSTLVATEKARRGDAADARLQRRGTSIRAFLCSSKVFNMI